VVIPAIQPSSHPGNGCSTDDRLVPTADRRGLTGLLAMAAAGDLLMSAVPRERAGVASAVNDTMSELSTALGVAVPGGVLASAYRSHLSAATPPAARTSRVDALAASASTGDVRLAAAARSAFAGAMERGLLVGAAVCSPSGPVRRSEPHARRPGTCAGARPSR
jgi:hypothetical protein